MEDSINQEATADNNDSVNNNMPADTSISNDAANPNSRSANDIFNGGGIHRMKKHLAKITGDVKKCPKVPYDVEKQMENLLKDIQASKKKRKVSFGEEGGDEVEDAIDEAIQEEQEQQRTSNQQGVGGDPKKKAKCNNLDSVQAMKEIHLYRDRKESFDRQEVIPAASELKPGEIDADLYQSGGGSSGLYAASLSSADQGGNEGEDHPTEADLQQVLADFD
ncbi:hypothetical protein Ahy_B03g063733 [Arachis hypogaea]|uniref:Uncharacterized protein n=1 Tax=Arachis hypogaea TaxID=3818 RepID=A0A444ZY02_ARAHY|nr:hypothetical protein Ahy_B03g063733 [Arachis hypogaea]